MATNTAGSTARELATQQTHFLRKQIDGEDGNQTVTMGVVPSGTIVTRIYTATRNSGGLTGGTATLSFGTSASPALYFAASTTPATTTGLNLVTIITAGGSVLTADTTLVAVVAGTPTGGSIDVVIEYVPNI